MCRPGAAQGLPQFQEDRPLPEPRTREPEAAQEGAWIFTFYGKGASPDLISDP